MIITIGNKEYDVKEAKTQEEKEKGLQRVSELPENEGMLFYFDDETVSMWMKYTDVPLDIIFINSDQEVTFVHKGIPNDKSLITVPNTTYVLEVNQNSGIKEGDELEFNDDAPVMKVLAPDGSVLYELYGGERIISQKETKTLIRKAKKADMSKEDKDYKALGKYLFKVFTKLDNRDPEYVKSPD